MTHGPKPCTRTRVDRVSHPAELLQQSVVLFGELADCLGLVSVGLPQLDLVELQLTLQLLDVRLQVRHAAFPLPLSTLQPPPQLMLLLLQVLCVDGGERRSCG